MKRRSDRNIFCALVALILSGGCLLPTRFDRMEYAGRASAGWPPDWLADSAAETDPAPSTTGLILTVRPSVVRIEVVEATGRRLAAELKAADQFLPIGSLLRDPVAFAWSIALLPVQIPPVRQYGSGFFIHRNGLIATNAHVVAYADSITVHTHDGARYDAVLDRKSVV